MKSEKNKSIAEKYFSDSRTIFSLIILASLAATILLSERGMNFAFLLTGPVILYCTQQLRKESKKNEENKRK